MRDDGAEPAFLGWRLARHLDLAKLERGPGRGVREDGIDTYAKVQISGGFNSKRGSDKTKKEMFINICVKWHGVDMDAITPRLEKYNSKSGLSRIEFIEQTFGVKFGERLPAHIEENLALSATVKLSTPIWGMYSVGFMGLTQPTRLHGLTFHRNSHSKSTADSKQECMKLCEELDNWLGVTSFLENHTYIESDNHDLFKFNSHYEDNDVIISVTCQLLTRVSPDSSLRITISSKEKGEAKSYDRPKNNSALTDTTLTSEEKRVKEKEIEKRMKEMVMPRLHLQPPATISDSIDLFRGVSNVIDDPRIPIEQRGLLFVLKVDHDEPLKQHSNISALNISMWDALNLVCKDVGFKFEINGSDINGPNVFVEVMPKDHTSHELITRNYPFPHSAYLKGATLTLELLESPELLDEWKAFFSRKGVNWYKGSTFRYFCFIAEPFFRICNTAEEHAKIEKILKELNAKRDKQ